MYLQGPWWDSSWCKVGGTPTTPITARSSAPAPAPGSSPSSLVSASSIPKSPSSAPADLKTNYKNGLPLDVLLSIAPAFIMLLPGEIYSPMVWSYARIWGVRHEAEKKCSLLMLGERSLICLQDGSRFSAAKEK